MGRQQPEAAELSLSNGSETGGSPEVFGMKVEKLYEIRAMKPGLDDKTKFNNEFDASATRDGSRSTQIETLNDDP